MADPTTLLELATRHRDAAQAAHTHAEQTLANASTDLGAAARDHAVASAAFAALEQRVAALRAALAQVATRADGEALLLELEQQTLALRTQQARLLEIESDVLVLSAAQAQARTALAAAATDLQQATADLAEVTQASTRRAALDAALAAPPLASLRNDANAALNTAPQNQSFTTARARLEADLPATLLAQARARRQPVRTHLDDLEALVRAAEDAGAERLAARFERAEADLEDYVGRAKSRYDAARQALARVADPTQSPLTAEQKARIHEATLKAKADAAAAIEKDRNDRRADLAAATKALAEALLIARAADIDADPEETQAVKDARQDLTDAQAALAQAEAAYTPALRNDLDTWEAAVPDATWRLLEDFETAHATLIELSQDPAPLAAALDAAEAALVTALLAADKKTRANAFFAAEAARHAAELASQQTLSTRASFSALRGDN